MEGLPLVHNDELARHIEDKCHYEIVRGAKKGQARHKGFGQVISIPAYSLIGNPALARWHPQGHCASRNGQQRSRTALPEEAALDQAAQTFSGDSSAPRAIAGGRLGGSRAVSAPHLKRYCEPSKHLSGKEIAAREKSRTNSSSSQMRSDSSQMRSGSSQLRACATSTASDVLGADGLSDHGEASSSSRAPRLHRSLWNGENMPSSEEEKRDAVREELSNLVGGSMEAFRMMDLSGSGKISMQEFTDGMERIGVRWQELTGFRWMLDIFALFDQNRDGVIDLEEFFPVDTRKEEVCKRLNTPDFLDHWCDSSDNFSGSAERNPSWGAGAPRDELNRLYKAKKHLQGVSDHRRWMSSMFRRLKSRGKSDAQCRECIAHHLPRGSGAKDRVSVQTFSEVEVNSCKRAYQDGMQNHVRNIQKEVYTMRDQRQNLLETRQQLFKITGPLLAAEKFEEEKKTVSIGLSGFNLLGHGGHQENDGEFSDSDGGGVVVG